MEMSGIGYTPKTQNQTGQRFGILDLFKVMILARKGLTENRDSRISWLIIAMIWYFPGILPKKNGHRSESE